MTLALIANLVLLVLSERGTRGEMTPLSSTAPKTPAQVTFLLQWAVLIVFFFEAGCGNFFAKYTASGAVRVSRELYGTSHWMCLACLILSMEMSFFYNYATGAQQRRGCWVVTIFNMVLLIALVKYAGLCSERRLKQMLVATSTLVLVSTYAVGNTRWPLAVLTGKTTPPKPAAPRTLFDKFDTNHDGVVDRTELGAGAASRMARVAEGEDRTG